MDVPVVLQHQAATIQTEQKIPEIPQSQRLHRVVDVHIATQHVPVPRAMTQQRLYPGPQVMTQDVLVPVAAPQAQVVDVPGFLDRVDDVPVVWPRQASLITTAQKTVEDPLFQCLNRVDDTLVSMQRSAPMTQKLPKMLKPPQVQSIDKVVNVPVTAQRQVPSVQRDQKIVEMPQIQCRRDRSVPKIVEQIVEAPRLIPQEFTLSPREDDRELNHRLAPQKRKSISESVTEDELTFRMWYAPRVRFMARSVLRDARSRPRGGVKP